MTIPSIPTVLLGLGLFFSSACEWFTPLNTDSAAISDLQRPADSDLTGGDDASKSPCSAATGVAGVLLKDMNGQDFCIDFKGSVTDDTLRTSGWTLGATQQGCAGFSVAGGILAISSPKNYLKADCQANLPTLTVPSGTKKIVVSIVHNLTFASINESGQIEERNTGQKYGWSGLNNDSAPSATTLEFSPEPSPESFTVALHARNTDTKAGPLPVWQIQSIAVLGIK